jgi:hypothetical protein
MPNQEANQLIFNSSESAGTRKSYCDFREVVCVLFYLDLISFEEAARCIKTKSISDLSTSGLEEVFKYGITLDVSKEPFALLAMRCLFPDLTLYN